MIILLSPSKTLDLSSPTKGKPTLPHFQIEIKEQVEKMQKLSEKDIAKMMGVSEKIAKENYARYQNFRFPLTEKNSRPAIFTFKGDVYKDIDVENYTEEDLNFAQDHVRILSGLYGVLRPLDLMQAYRLEMKYREKFWQEKLTGYFQNITEPIINLASNEYSAPIKFKELKTKIYTPLFKQKKGKEYKITPIYAKIARGTMTNWIIKNRINTLEEIKNFRENNYHFAKEFSTDKEYVFIRG